MPHTKSKTPATPGDTSAEHRLATQELILDYCRRFTAHDHQIDLDLLRGLSAIAVLQAAIAAGQLERDATETQALDWQLDYLKAAWKRIQH